MGVLRRRVECGVASPPKPSGAASSLALAHDMVRMLDLEELDRDLYRGVNTVDSPGRPSLFGGQVAAQALRAAGLTVAGDRSPHSLHGYFLRRGRPERPVILRVDRDRDGRSFSARHVAAVQDGEVIFSMLASFHEDEFGGSFDGMPTGSPEAPEGDVAQGWNPLVDLRELSSTPKPGATAAADRAWVRARHPLPDDRLIQACALTYVSDFGSGFSQVDEPHIPSGGPSIDHCLWFHTPIRVDDWVLIELWPAKVGGARGLYFGAMRDRAGLLGATLAQEVLLRPSTTP
jgi:acyl-CoA thioesterase-2